MLVLGGLNVRRQHGGVGDRKKIKDRRKQTHPRSWLLMTILSFSKFIKYVSCEFD